MKILNYAALVITLGFLSLSAQGATINVSASVWGSARDDGRDGSFESISFTDAIVFQRHFGADYVDRGLWEFDLSELPSETILSVSLQLSIISTTLDRTNFDVYGYAGNGTIEAADAMVGDLLAADLNGTESIPIIFDVTSFILDPDIQAAGFAGFMARYPDEMSGSTLQKQLNTPPWLVVEYTAVPIPAAVWLFGSGLGLLGWIGRKAT